MKNLLKLSLLILLLASCKDKSESSGSSESDIVEGVMNEMTSKNDDINEKYDLLLTELQTKKPLTNDQLIQAFPKKLSALNLDLSEENKLEPRIIDNQLVAGKFGDDTVRMEILDAADQKAVGAILPLKMFHLNKITSENNNTIRYSKIERNGILTFGIDRDDDTTSDFQSEIRFLYDNRFYVTLEGKRMNTDELWNAMDVDNLKPYQELNK